MYANRSFEVISSGHSQDQLFNPVPVHITEHSGVACVVLSVHVLVFRLEASISVSVANTLIFRGAADQSQICLKFA